MPMLKATRTVRYGRVEYKFGEIFEASERDAKVLVAIRKAVTADAAPNTAAAVLDPPPPAPPVPDLASLRGEYEKVTGKRPFMGWGPEQLRSRMNTYLRRDMRAED